MGGFSSLKDTDREILLRLSDKELIQTCRLNKYLFKNVCDDNFFRRKLSLSYPDTLPFYNANKYINYKNFYLNMVFYIAKLEEDFKYSYISGNPKAQYDIFRSVSLKRVRNGQREFHVNYQELLRKAAQEGELNLVEEAVKNGADVNRYGTALVDASNYGYLEIVKYLVEQGTNIHIYDELALRAASASGHLNVVKYLVSQGADISAKNDAALKWAKEEGQLDVVNYLSGL